MTSFEFSRAGCAWCHPGGGGMEYDREGYRYDGAAGLFSGGANPTPKNGDYFIFGIDASSAVDASSYAGAGFFELPAAALQVKGIMTPASAFNMGSAKMADSGGGVFRQVAKKNVALTTGGIAEADCLMCHYANQYSQVDRNWAANGYQQPKWMASLGLVGAKGQAGLLSGTTVTARCTTGSPCTVGVNPALNIPSWTTVELTPSMIVKAPKNEGCSVCHFFDNTFTTLGPAGKPMGNTAWQKYYPVASSPDGDIGPSHASYNGGSNIVAWQVAKGKPEGGKRAESINDNNNPDAHMKWPAYSGDPGNRMTCSVCHYNLSGTFPALMDGADVIYPATTVEKMDHQFAKGDNLPDGKNMDQLDNTVNCASCHIDRTHPNKGTAPVPAHAGFPAVHFEKLDCRVCHIPVLNAKSIWKIADFTVGPYRTFERNQAPENPLGSNAKPLYIWRKSSTSDTIKLEPVNTTTVPVWTDNDPLKPTFQRVAKSAAEAKRAADITANGYLINNIASFALNTAQGGDTTLIVNTTAEITDMVSKVIAASGNPALTPVMNFYINAFDVSHGVMPKGGKCIDRNADGDTLDAGECNYILGATEGGGCAMCHASSNPSSPNYNASSVGFFDRTHTLFTQPLEVDTAVTPTSAGMHQLTIGGVKRVAVKYSGIKSDGSANVIDLANVADGAVVGNTLNQGAVMGYTDTQLAVLTSLFSTETTSATPVARFAYSTTGLTVNVDAGASTGTITSYAWDFGDAASTATGVTASHTYPATGTYTVSLNVTGPGGNNVKFMTIQLTAPNNAPDAVGTAVANGLSVTVTGTSTDVDGDTLGALVNWGDGTFSNATNPVNVGHVYSAGTYSIYLHVTDKRGGSDTLFLGQFSMAASLGSVSGTVTSSTGTVLPNAVVTLYSAGSTTPVEAVYSASNGSFALANVASGTYDIGVRLNGYSFDLMTGVTVTAPGNTAAGNIAALPTFSVSGTITNAPTSGLLVQLCTTPSCAVVVGQALSYGQLGGGFSISGVIHGPYFIVPQPVAPATVDPTSVAVTVINASVVSGATITYAPL
jgi:PKD repeat protein